MARAHSQAKPFTFWLDSESERRELGFTPSFKAMFTEAKGASMRNLDAPSTSQYHLSGNHIFIT